MLLSLKGNPGIKEATVLHFRNDPQVAHADGMLEVAFRTEGRVFDGQIEKKGFPSEKIKYAEGKPHYLLFLTARADGRYEPVSGQYDAALSVREMHAPLSFPPDSEK